MPTLEDVARLAAYQQAYSPTNTLARKIANDPVVQGLANAISSNPVVKSVTDYVQQKTPLEVANDIASVGSVAATMANPYTAPIGLMRFAPRAVPVVRGLVAGGKEYIENKLTDAIVDEAARNSTMTGLTAEDVAHITKTVRRK